MILPAGIAAAVLAVLVGAERPRLAVLLGLVAVLCVAAWCIGRARPRPPAQL